MIARVVLTTTSTTAVRIIAKGVFMVTSLMRVYHQLFAVENESALNGQGHPQRPLVTNAMSAMGQ
jgi:hypothetical protein